MSFSTAKIEEIAPYLTEYCEAANKVLRKTGLTNNNVRMAVCLDFSHSMQHLYKEGKVKRLLDKVLTLNCLYSQDEGLEVFLCGNHAYYAGSMTLKSADTFVNTITEKYKLETDTNYATAIQLIRQHYFPERNGDYIYEATHTKKPIWVLFITDSDTLDKEITEKQMIAASYEPIFWQFIAIGHSNKEMVYKKGVLGWLLREITGNFHFLEHLDTMEGRYVDNANYFSITEPDDIHESHFYNLLMTEYPLWIERIREKNMLG